MACARVQSHVQYTQQIHADSSTEAETGTRRESTLEPRSARKPRAELSRLKSAIQRASAYVAPASMRECECALMAHFVAPSPFSAEYLLKKLTSFTKSHRTTLWPWERLCACDDSPQVALHASGHANMCACTLCVCMCACIRERVRADTGKHAAIEARRWHHQSAFAQARIQKRKISCVTHPVGSTRLCRLTVTHRHKHRRMTQAHQAHGEGPGADRQR